MAARTAMGMAGAATAVYLVVAVTTGLSAWWAVLVAPILVAATFRRVRGTDAGDTGIVDCTGTRLTIGDRVRGGTGFDGPMELAFGRGVVVKVGHGKAHVRFNDIPEQIHPITPSALRRLA
jgi:hypothetical protein